jgi:hypothetical protein
MTPHSVAYAVTLTLVMLILLFPPRPSFIERFPRVSRGIGLWVAEALTHISVYHTAYHQSQSACDPDVSCALPRMPRMSLSSWLIPHILDGLVVGEEFATGFLKCTCLIDSLMECGSGLCANAEAS